MSELTKGQFLADERKRARESQTWRDSTYELSETELEDIERQIELRWFYEQEAREQRAQRRIAEFKASMPGRAAAVALAIEANTTDPALLEIAKWMEGDRNIAVLTGPVGTGKTVAAAWWARMNDRMTTFVTATEIAKASRYDDERDRWLKATNLILDDLGAEYLDAKGSLQTDIDELVNEFYSRPHRRLMITTNLPRKAFADRYGQRVADRLHEAGTWIVMTGESRRRQVKP